MKKLRKDVHVGFRSECTEMLPAIRDMERCMELFVHFQKIVKLRGDYGREHEIFIGDNYMFNGGKAGYKLSQKAAEVLLDFADKECVKYAARLMWGYESVREELKAFDKSETSIRENKVMPIVAVLKFTNMRKK